MRVSYSPKGVCSKKIEFDIIDGKLYNIVFTSGCNGNTKGIAALAEGMEATDLVQRCTGISCGGRSTSCPEQLAIAVQRALEKQ